MKTKQAISLIVLVITIIVMIVLAGAIILTLNNTGIIGKASEAVEKTDKATLEEIASLAWAEAYAENASSNNKLTGTDLENKLKQKIEDALTSNGLNPNEYGITVTEKGFKIAKGWLQDGLEVKKGNQVLNIADDFNYDEPTDGTKNVTWKVLGASDEGELLILSNESVAEIQLSEEGNITKSQDGYINGVARLNEKCEPYGNGLGVSGKARCIKVEDINKITGYKPEVGRIMTFTWDGGTRPSYKSTDGFNGITTKEYNGSFIYYDGNQFTTSTNSGATQENPKEIITINSTKYTYFPTTLTDDENSSKIGLSVDEDSYKMIFNNEKYWLASPYIVAGKGGIVYGYNWCASNKITAHDFITSWGETLGQPRGVRVVVALSANIEIKDLQKMDGNMR